MRPEAQVAIALYRSLHGGVHRGDDAAGVAARVVAAEHIAPQCLMHKGQRGLEHLRLGTAKAVNALLGVAHNEHAGCRASAAARIAAQPRQQRLPLQRVGVLKLVDQQMADAGVQPLLHPARQHRVAQQYQGRALHVVHVHPALLALDLCKISDEHAGQPRHALLISPGIALVACFHHLEHQLLRLANGRDACDLLAKLARRAFFGEQRGKGGGQVAFGQCGFQLHALGRKRGRAGPAQGFGCGTQELQVRRDASQEFFGGVQARKLGELITKRQYRPIHHAVGVGQRKFNPLVQRRLQGFVGLEAAMCKHQCLKVGLAIRIGQQARIEAPPHQGGGF